MLDLVALASIASAVAVLGNEYLKGVASEAGKSTWTGVKSLLGWNSDPTPAEIPAKVVNAVTTTPEVGEALLRLLKSNDTGSATSIVGNINAAGGKIDVAHSITTDRFQM